MVFQSFNLFAHMSILQNVTLGPVAVSYTHLVRSSRSMMLRRAWRLESGVRPMCAPSATPPCAARFGSSSPCIASKAF